jgi:predicted DNA-binding ribbon-helix-helix protein
VTLVLEAEQYEELEKVARARGLSVSALLRSIIERELQSLRQPEQAAIPEDPLG